MPEPYRWQPSLTVRFSATLHGTAAGMLALHPAWWPGLVGTVAANHLVLGAAGLWPGSTLLGPSVHRLPQSGPRAALTFDDGPDPEVTPRVLDLLAAKGATASFFCIASRAQANPGLVRRIVSAGHRVENHTLTHPKHFALLFGRALRREIADAQAILADLTGIAPRWFRAPMGLRSPPLYPALARAGLRLAGWSRRGYDTQCGDPALVLRRLLQGLAPGALLLLHDGNAAAAPDGGAVSLHVLPRLLDALAAAGLSAVPLPDPEDAGAESPSSGGCASR